MPIYEYECRQCACQFQQIILNEAEEDELSCPACAGRELKRLISRVAFHLSENDRLDAYDPAKPQPDSFYNDSRNIGLHAKKRARDMGVDLGGSFENKLERLRTNPGSVLQDTE